MWQAIIRVNGNVLARMASVNGEDVVAVINKCYSNEGCTKFKTKAAAKQAAKRYNPNIVFLYRFEQQKAISN